MWGFQGNLLKGNSEIKRKAGEGDSDLFLYFLL